MFYVIKPQLLYCLPVWGNCCLTEQHCFDSTLTRCARFVLNNNNAILSQNIYDETSICNFSCNVLLSSMDTVFKIVHFSPIDDFNTCIMLANTSLRQSRASDSNKVAPYVMNRKIDD